MENQSELPLPGTLRCSLYEVKRNQNMMIMMVAVVVETKEEEEEEKKRVLEVKYQMIL